MSSCGTGGKMKDNFINLLGLTVYRGMQLICQAFKMLIYTSVFYFYWLWFVAPLLHLDNMS